MTEYSREAEALARTMAPDGDWYLDEWRIAVRIAQRAIDAGWVQRDDLIALGWTPPDPYEDIARELWGAQGLVSDGWNPQRSAAQADLLAVVRRIPDDLARQVAEALRGES